MVAAMERGQCRRRAAVSPFTMYRYDASYAIEVHRAHPSRFALVKPVRSNRPAVAETIADWAATDGTVGIRIMMRGDTSPDPADPGINRVLAAAARHSLTVNLMATGRLEQAGGLAAPQPQHESGDRPSRSAAAARAARSCPTLADLPKLLALASHPNVAVKISGACTLSHEPFPYKDIWDPLGRISMRLG